MIRPAVAAIGGLHGVIHLIGFLVADVGIGRRTPWAPQLTAALAVASIAVWVLSLPETMAGIAVNVAILCAVAWSSRFQTRPIGVTS